MKSILITLLITLSLSSFSQDYMDKIALESCECIDRVSDTVPMDQFNMELGLCMLEASMPYQKQLKKDHGINWDRIDKEGEKLGRLIGMKLASVCPNSLMRMVKKVSPELMDDEDEEIDDELYAEGEIQKVEEEQFIVISVKEESGKVSKFYWMTFIDSDFDLANDYNSLIGKKAVLTYEEYEFFDPRLKEYRVFNVINALDAF
ncbi:MAG: hypothetical protein RLZZ337_1330 [Bacteroidota bacterium]